MKPLRRRRIYIFINQKNPYLNIIATICLLVVIILVATIFGSALLKENKVFQSDRNEIDPRKTLRIDYANISKVETNNAPERLISYMYDGKYIHYRNEKNLKYASISIDGLRDFSVFKNQSVVLKENGSIYYGDQYFKSLTPVLSKEDVGPKELTNRTYQYGEKIITFQDGKVYSYDTKLNYWENISEKLSLPKFSDIRFSDGYFFGTTEKELYLFYPKDLSQFMTAKLENSIVDISYSDADVYVLDEKHNIFKVNTSDLKIQKLFEDSTYEGNKIVGCRFVDGFLYVLTDKVLNLYDPTSRKWSSHNFDTPLIDFYIANNVFVVSQDKFYVFDKTLKSIETINYEKFYYFDGKDFYYYKDGKIYSYYDKNFVFAFPKEGFENFDPTKVKDVFYYKTNLVLSTGDVLYIYNFSNKSYTTIKGVKNIVMYESALYYIKKDQLFKYDLDNNKTSSIDTDVIDYDVYKGSITYLKGDGTLNIDGKNYFTGSLNFNTDNLRAMQKFQDNVLMINDKAALNFNYTTMNATVVKTFEGRFQQFKRFDEENFSVLTDKQIYFFSSGKYVKQIPTVGKLINSRGDYFVFLINESGVNTYRLIDKSGNVFEYKKLIPFNSGDVKNFWALGDKIIFHLVNGQIFSFMPKTLTFEKLNVSYDGDISNIQTFNGTTYCINNGTLYELLSKKKIEDGVLDYTSWKNALAILKKDGYVKIGDDTYFTKSISYDILSAECLTQRTYENHYFVIITKSGIVRIDLNNFNVENKSISITEASFYSQNEAWIVSAGTLYKLNIAASELKLTKVLSLSNINPSLGKGATYVSNGVIKSIDTAGKVSDVHDFEIKSFAGKSVKQAYYSNNYLYVFGDKFYASYDVNAHKWANLVDNLSSIQVACVGDKIIGKIDGNRGFFENGTFVSDENTIFGTYNSIKGYFAGSGIDLSDIKAIDIIDNVVVMFAGNEVICYSNEKRSWQKYWTFNDVIDIFNEPDAMMIFGKGYIARIYVSHSEPQKAVLEFNYDISNYDYSDFIVLKNGDDYVTFNKNLQQLGTFAVPSRDIQSAKDVFYLNNKLYIISPSKVLVFDTSTKERLYNYSYDRYLYTGGKLYLLTNGRLYVSSNSENDFEVISDGVTDFAAFGGQFIVRGKNDIKSNDKNIGNPLLFIAGNYYLLLSNDSMHIYDNSNKLIRTFDVDGNISSAELLKDQRNGKDYLKLYVNQEQEILYYDIRSVQKTPKFRITSNGNILADYIYNDTLYVVYNNSVEEYSTNGAKKTYSLSIPHMDRIFQMNGQIYFEMANEYYKMLSLTKYETTPISYYEKLKNSSSYLVKTNGKYYLNWSDEFKPLDYGKSALKIGNSYILTSTKRLLSAEGIKQYSQSINYGNFVQLTIGKDKLFVTDEGITKYGDFVKNISSIKMNNTVINSNDKLIKRTENGKEKIIKKKVLGETVLFEFNAETMPSTSTTNPSQNTQIVQATQTTQTTQATQTKQTTQTVTVMPKPTSETEYDFVSLVKYLLDHNTNLTFDAKAKMLTVSTVKSMKSVMYDEIGGFIIFNDGNFFNGKRVSSYTSTYKLRDMVVVETSNGMLTNLPLDNTKKGAVVFNPDGMFSFNSNLEPGIYFGNKKIDTPNFSGDIYESNGRLIFDTDHLFFVSVDRDTLLSPSNKNKLDYSKSLSSVDVRNVGVDTNGNYYITFPNNIFINLSSYSMNKTPSDVTRLFNDSNGALIIRTKDGNYYMLNGNNFVPTTPGTIRVEDQSIEFGNKFNVQSVSRVLNEEKKVRWFGGIYSPYELFTSGRFVFEDPEQVTYDGNSFIFKVRGNVYRYNSPFSMQKLDTSVQSIAILNGKFTERSYAKNSFRKHFTVNVDLVNGKIAKGESNANVLKINGQQVSTSITERILLAFTFNNNIYVVTNYHVYNLSGGSSALLTLNAIKSANMLVNKIYLLTSDNKEYLFDIATQTLNKYNGERISVDLDSKKTELNTYYLRAFNSLFTFSELSTEKEIFGLLKINKAVSMNDGTYIAAGGNLLKLNGTSINLIKKFGHIDKLYVIDDEIFINDAYAYGNNGLKAVDANYILQKKGINDIYYDGKSLNYAISNDLHADVFVSNVPSKRAKLFFNTIYSLKSMDDNLTLVTDTGVFSYSLSQVPEMMNAINIKSANKVIGVEIINSEGKNFLLQADMKLSPTLNDPKISVRISKDYTLTNYLDNQKDIKVVLDNTQMSILNSLLNYKYDVVLHSGKLLNILQPTEKLLFIFGENGISNILSDAKVLQIFSANDNLVISTTSGEFILDYSTLEKKLYDNSKEMLNYSFDLETKNAKVSTLPTLSISGIKVNNLSDIIPKAVFISGDGTTNFSTSFGIYDMNFKKILGSNLIVKKRIGNVIYLETKDKKFGYNFENVPFYPTTQLIVDKDGFHATISDKFGFSFYGFSLKELIKNGRFDFDNFEGDFLVYDGKLYNSTGLGTWKFDGFPQYISKEKVVNSKVVVENDSEKIVRLTNKDANIVPSNYVVVEISSLVKVNQKVVNDKDTNPHMVLSNGENAIYKNRLLFDTMENIYYDASTLWNVNNYGAFSPNNFIFEKNLEKQNFSNSDYFYKDGKTLKIVKGKITPVSLSELELTDNKWYWHVAVDSLSFENKFDKSLKRTYDKGTFLDDVITDVYLNDGKLYTKSVDKLVTIYDGTIPTKMMALTNESFEEFNDLSSITFSSKKYTYSFTKGNEYIKVSRRKDNE